VDNPELVSYYEFQFKTTGATDYNSRIVYDGEFTLSPALSNTSYNYRVRTFNQLGVKSAFVSGASTVSTGNDSTTPKAPTSVSVTGGYGAASVTWTAPTQNTDDTALKDLFQYNVYRGTTTNPTTLVGRVSGEVFSDSGLADSTTYHYRVKAADFTGNESAYSASASGTTLTAPEGQNGARGAGRWNIGIAAVNAGSFSTGTTYWITTVGTTDFTAIGATANTVGLSFTATGAGSGTGTATPLPTTSSGANTDFVAAIGSPVDLDQAWFYAGTQASPVAQKVWIYDADTTSWSEQTEVIDGNLLVTGSINASKIAISDESLNDRVEIASNKILVYNGGVLRVKIGDLS
jgi:hypothetical protein